jgi:hypothetical protein
MLRAVPTGRFFRSESEFISLRYLRESKPIVITSLMSLPMGCRSTGSIVVPNALSSQDTMPRRILLSYNIKNKVRVRGRRLVCTTACEGMWRLTDSIPKT